MPRLQYGSTTIQWVFRPDDKLKRHYVTVERGRSVVLRGPRVGVAEQEALVKKRARWIRERQAMVNQLQASHDVVTGSRLRYGGRSYFTEVRHVPELQTLQLSFTASRFVIESPYGSSLTKAACRTLLMAFYRERAKDKLLARVRHWQRVTGLVCKGARVRVFQSRWASCNADDLLEFHPRMMELPASVQEYIVIHELCHTVEKNHTKAFWSLVSKHMPDWRSQHELLEQAAFGDAV